MNLSTLARALHRAVAATVAATLLTATFVAAPAPPAEAAPGPGTVGVKAGTVLRASGPLWITKPGTVVDGLDVNGCVTVLAGDVTIRNTRIRCGGSVTAVLTRIPSGGGGLVIEDSEIDGLDSTEVGVGYTAYTLRRVNVHSVADGARFGHRVLIEDSWIHALSRQGSLHGDAVQTTSASNSTIRRNVLDSTSLDGRDLNNAALMLGSETGTRKVVDVLIEDNVLAGGNATLNIRADITASNLVIRNNTFGPVRRYGPAQAPRSVPLGSGNVESSTGMPISVFIAK